MDCWNENWNGIDPLNLPMLGRLAEFMLLDASEAPNELEASKIADEAYLLLEHLMGISSPRAIH